MILVKKHQFFLYNFLVKLRLEIMFNGVLNKKEAFLEYQKVSFSKSPKLHFFQDYGQKTRIFFCIFLVKIRLKIIYDVLDEKRSLSRLQKRVPKNRIFFKGLTHDFGQKARILSLFFSLVKLSEIIFNGVLDKKKLF